MIFFFFFFYAIPEVYRVSVDLCSVSSTKFREQGYGQDVDKSLHRPPDRLQFESVLRPLRSGKGCGSQSVPPLPPLSHGQDHREEVNVGCHPGRTKAQ